MHVLPGSKINPIVLKPKLQGSFHPSDNWFLKYYLYEATFYLVRCNNEYSDFQYLKYKEVNNYQHDPVLVLIVHKFVRLVFLLLNDNRPYSPAK